MGQTDNVPARRRRRGSSLVEFTFVGIPLLFILIAVAEMSRGMWSYYLLATAVNTACRTASLHGAGCGSPNSCQVTIGTLATQIQSAGPGLIPQSINVTLTSPSGSTTCNPLSSCSGNSSVWPPAGGNSVGANIEISATYVFSSGLAMFVPGSGGFIFGKARFAAYSRQQVQF
jgi:hypothetical protein